MTVMQQGLVAHVVGFQLFNRLCKAWSVWWQTGRMQNYSPGHKRGWESILRGDCSVLSIHTHLSVSVCCCLGPCVEQGPGMSFHDEYAMVNGKFLLYALTRELWSLTVLDMGWDVYSFSSFRSSCNLTKGYFMLEDQQWFSSADKMTIIF